MFLESPRFRIWLVFMFCLWVGLFSAFNSFEFVREHWYYPATMVLGAFVAGSTPEGGGAVAFPVLSVFFQIDRTLARDFSLMIQSVGMTSASVFILTHPSTDVKAFRPLPAFIAVAFVGFVVGMHTLQTIPVVQIQALFLALITAFSVAYLLGRVRGGQDRYHAPLLKHRIETAFVMFLGGLCASLFGTGLDILAYTLMVTRFRLREKLATEMSVIMMAAMSLLGYAYRGLVQQELTDYQIRTWLSAFPVVLVMAPLGAYVLKRVNKERLLIGVVVLNVAQLMYFNLHKPTMEKTVSSLAFTALLLAFFFWVIHLIRKRDASGLASGASS